MFVSYLQDHQLKLLANREVLIFLPGDSAGSSASALEAKALSIIKDIEAPDCHLRTFHVGSFEAYRRRLRMRDNADIIIASHSLAQLHKVKNYQIILIQEPSLNIILIPTTPISLWSRTRAAVIKFSVTTTLKEN